MNRLLLLLFLACTVHAQPIITAIQVKDKHPTATVYLVFTTPVPGALYEVQYKPVANPRWLYLPGYITATSSTAVAVIVLNDNNALFRIVQTIRPPIKP